MPTGALHDFRYEGAERYRNFAEERILRFLCSPFELAAGRVETEYATVGALLAHLRGLGLPFRTDAAGLRRYDLAELVNFIKYAHFALGDGTWPERSVATMRRLMALPGTPPRRHALTLGRRLSRLEPGDGLRLHLPKPLNAAPGRHAVTWVEDSGAEPRDEGSRYVLRVRVPPDGTVAVKARHVFECGTGWAQEAPDERYLRVREGLVHAGPAVVALAQRLGLRDVAPLAAMHRIWDYLGDEISFGFIHYDRLAADDPLGWVLAHRRADCRTGSALIVALCRAAGIPARLLTGYTLHPVLPTAHAWCEAWIEGAWLPFDTYAIDLAGPERDSAWRHHFFGRIDDRFVAECLPLSFCSGPRLPAAWQLCAGLAGGEATTWYEEVGSGRPIYAETVSVSLV